MNPAATQHAAQSSGITRRTLEIRGIVQGVGFRPFVHKLATSCGLTGTVRNGSGRVVIEAEGPTAALDRFCRTIRSAPPPLAVIYEVKVSPTPVLGDPTFTITPSDEAEHSDIFISPDIAVCNDCLTELNDPSDRRYQYPFINCTNCGPRLTIVTGSPYDRPRTTMADFDMCHACRAEYDNPADRRFHAQPITCPRCGPQLSVLTKTGKRIIGTSAINHFADAIVAGHIGALKGIGGYHLACDATNAAAVAALRHRKQREEKPFAVMVADLNTVTHHAHLNPTEASLLCSAQSPIVLLDRKSHSSIAANVAPNDPRLGVMLPYTPLHHMLMQRTARPLVMTSGNRSDEPIAYTNQHAMQRLADIADTLLLHDRPIHIRCDDSVTYIANGKPSMLRRSRGYAPLPLQLPHKTPTPLLAVGGQLKSAFALIRDSNAFLSQHLGDLHHFEAYRAFERDIGLYRKLFAIHPQAIAHDLHPDYASTHYAESLAAAENLPLIPVQHHHAHMASCMAEHHLTGPAIGVIFDGTGYGTDGTVWGGEFLIGDYHAAQRAAHLRPTPMPGGEKAITEPWRMALAHLNEAGLSDTSTPLAKRLAPESIKTISRMLDRNLNTPMTTSMGRLFDAVASLIGQRDSVSYEGQAAIELERLAVAPLGDSTYPFRLIEQSDGPMIIDTRPLIRAVTTDVAESISAKVIATTFHQSVTQMVVSVAERLGQSHRLNQIVLSGGVFVNRILSDLTAAALQRQGFEVYTHQQVPAGDGGLSYGQAAVAAAKLLRLEHES